VVPSRRAARGSRDRGRGGTQPTRHGRTASKVVKGRRALGQPGLGRVPRRLRLPGSRLNRLHPGVVYGEAGDPLTVGFLDNLLGEVGQPCPGCLVS
jgi:hypothetical protein